MFKAFLIKYAEIGLKGNNRFIFENALRDRVKEALNRLGDFAVSKEQGRIFVECPQEYDYDETVAALQKVFGISSICPVAVIDSSEWEDLTAGVGNYVEQMYPDRNFTFKVEAKRADKRYKPYLT